MKSAVQKTQLIFFCGALFFLASACGPLLLTHLYAQESSFGAIRGVVEDADFGERVPGVTLSLVGQGTSDTQTSDEQGNFVFNQVQPGVYEINVTKEGYVRSSVQEIALSAGQVRDVTIPITSQIFELDDFVTTAPEVASEDTAVAVLQNRQQQISFVDALGEEFLSQAGGATAADSLGRITGVSISGGKFVVVRGLADRYTSVTVNGGRVPSPDPDRRAVNVDIFPSDLVGGIEAKKTFTPDQYGDLVGGNVNISTKSFPDEFFLSFSIGTGYNTTVSLNDNWLTYDNGGAGVFATDDEGIREFDPILRSAAERQFVSPVNPGNLAGFTLTPLKQSFEDVLDATTPTLAVRRETAPLDYDFSVSIGDSFEFFGQPAGYLAAFTYNREYSLIEDGDFGRFGFQGGLNPESLRRFDEGTEEVFVGFLFSSGWDFAPNQSLRFDFLYNRTAEDTASFAVDFQPDPDEEIDVLQYVQRELSLAQLTGEHILEVGKKEVKINWLASSALSGQEEPDLREFVAQRNSSTSFTTDITPQTGNRRTWRFLDETNYGFKLDIELPLFEKLESEHKLKFGAAYDFGERSFEQFEFRYRIPTGVSTGLGLQFFNSSTQRFADVFASDDRTGLLGPSIIPSPFFQNVFGFYLEPPGSESFYDATQRFGGIYAMLENEVSDNLQVVWGLRAELTDFSVTAPVTDFNLFGTTTTSRIDVLPALAVTWDFFRDMRLRFAASRTIARPSFKELSPVTISDPGTDDVFLGNAALETSNVTNVDLRWEWFPRPGEVIAVSAFTKRIENPIELSQFQLAESIFIRPENFPEAVVYGLEFEFQKNLDQHSELLRDFSFGTNFAYIISTVALDPVTIQTNQNFGIDGTTRRLQDQPDYTFNFNLTYNNEELGLEWGVLYNITGPRIFLVGGAGQTDVFELPAGDLDMFIRKKFGDHFSVTLRAGNLINPVRRREYSLGGATYEEFRAGRSYSLSAKYDW